MRWRISRYARVLVVSALSLATVLAASVSAPAVADDYRVPGIDVSKYQGRIDWRAVGTSTVRFAVLRATLGNGYRDGKYARNVAQARANGIVVGAYHFAKPGHVPADPRQEADHFLRVARIAPGDIVPVLDIEYSGGRSARQLRAWAIRWLNRVQARTGVRPMIYSGNHFWRGPMNNTRWFAKRGYALWVAHWYVRAPSVPGGGWGGRGYTMWQWSAVGRIPGIRGPVDRDYVRGSLGQATIASIRVRPSEGGVIVGPRLLCGGVMSVCARMANPGDLVTLTARPSTGRHVLRWTGACVHAGDAPTCTLSAFEEKSVSVVFGGGGDAAADAADADQGSEGSGSPSAAPTPSPSPSPSPTPIIPSPSSSSRPSREVAPAPPRAEPAASPRADDAGDGTRFSWSRKVSRRAIGGSYRWERRASASVEYAFRGRSITLFTMRGRSMGRARISIDGVRVATIDGYRRRLRSVGRRFTGLEPGAHTLTVTPLGDKRPAAKDRRVAVDALRWGGRLHRDPVPEAVTWATVGSRAASDGRFAISDAAGAEMALRFSGSAISLDAVEGPAGGRARVWVDGRLVRTIDLYAPTRRVQPIGLAAGLAQGPHHARLVVLRDRHRKSTGHEVGIDRWIVSYRPERGRHNAFGLRTH